MPSTLADGVSLTTTNASATHYTLTIMTVVAVIFTPLVLVYQGWTYWVFRKRIATHHIPTPAPVPAEPMRPTDPWLRQQLAPARRQLLAVVGGGVTSCGLVIGQAWAVAGLVLAVLRGHELDHARAGAGRRAGRSGRGRCSERPRGGPSRDRGRHVTAPPADDRRRRARPPRLHRSGLGAGHPRGLGCRALPHPVPSGAGAGHPAAAAHRRRHRHPGPAQRGHRAVHAAAGAGVRCPGRPGHPRPGPRAVAGDVLAVRPLPRRRPRPADAGGAPPGARAVLADRSDHEPLPGRLTADPADRVRLVAGARARGHAVGGPGRGDRRRPPGRWVARAPHRARRPAARPRGVLAAAAGRGRVPRCRRGRGHLRGRPRRARGARQGHGQWPGRHCACR